jgi:hypothetical protein
LIHAGTLATRTDAARSCENAPAPGFPSVFTLELLTQFDLEISTFFGSGLRVEGLDELRAVDAPVSVQSLRPLAFLVAVVRGGGEVLAFT